MQFGFGPDGLKMLKLHMRMHASPTAFRSHLAIDISGLLRGCGVDNHMNRVRT